MRGHWCAPSAVQCKKCNEQLCTRRVHIRKCSVHCCTSLHEMCTCVDTGVQQVQCSARSAMNSCALVVCTSESAVSTAARLCTRCAHAWKLVCSKCKKCNEQLCTRRVHIRKCSVHCCTSLHEMCTCVDTGVQQVQWSARSAMNSCELVVCTSESAVSTAARLCTRCAHAWTLVCTKCSAVQEVQ